jgi:hypothetical protein
MDSFAGVGFWYIPDQTGILIVQATTLFSYAVLGWAVDDYGNGDVYISSGIFEFQLDPFSFTGQSWQFPFHMASVDAGWLGDSDQKTNRPGDKLFLMPFPFAWVKPGFGYACWIWIQASTARDDEGVGWAQIDTTVTGFPFFLVT